MKRKIFFALTILCFCLTAKADHITGGEMYYTYVGQSGANLLYDVTLRFYMRCNSGRQFNNPTVIAVFDRATNRNITSISVPLASQEMISITDPNPCITNPPRVCYEIGIYHARLTLPATPAGYILASMVNYRINGIDNLTQGYSQIGATYTAQIPGISQLPSATQNNSAHFIGSDLVIICANNSFAYSFAAEDADGDELRYSFCEAYQSGTNSTGGPPNNPPYESVPYGSGFSSSAPLGSRVKIDSKTGLITGIAPESGVYVVTVCVEEVRNGVVIATQRKDLQINIASCTIAAASLEPEYQLCGESRTLTASNLSNSPLIKTYDWQVLSPQGQVLHTSTNPSISYTFADTGLYSLKLIINKTDQCSDSTLSPVRVYPGFKPDFSFSGVCLNKPTQFTDRSTSTYGSINSWNWSLGPGATGTTGRTPSVTYTSTGIHYAILEVTDTKGCRDTAEREVSIMDKPPLNMRFRDTLICVSDRLQLEAIGNGLFSWSPSNGVTNGATATPTVSPATTTTYKVTLDDNGCVATDTVRVRVVDHVTLRAMADTTICSTDPIQLRCQSDGLRFAWTPAATLNNGSLFSPIATTAITTTYQVRATIGGCTATDDVVVTAVPYPKVNAGIDTTICFGAKTQLAATSDGTSLSWMPAASLSSVSSLSPVATPPGTTTYILTARDNRGCPKPASDTVLITVLPEIPAFAGRDTAVLIGQEVQFGASGGVAYEWSPPYALSATDVANPVGIYDEAIDAIRYQVLVYDEAGCVDSASILVRVFKTGPEVFVPTAFTPNGDGRNDVLRPIAAGMQQVEYFRVFNRWGQLVFHTARSGEGWDGRIKGKEQDTGVFVWEVKAVDHLGAPYFRKGTVTLIR
jgi:gliding motility-associated-like protein